MENILKDLYFGKYAAFERRFAPNSDHAAAIDKVVALEDALIEKLPNELVDQFREYSNAVADLASLSGEEEFEEGYKLGVRMMLAAFPEEYKNVDLPVLPNQK